MFWRHLRAVVFFCGALLVAARLMLAPALASELNMVRFYSAELSREWEYNVYLPNGYASGAMRYPVLYLLHGYGEGRDEWVVKGNIVEIVDRLIAAGEIPPCIVIMPTAGASWYINSKEKVESAFIQNLIPDVDARFRTITRRAGRVISGESMGGYGALRFILKYPELFMAGALLSPAIYTPLPPANSGARRSAAFEVDGKFVPELWEQNNYPALIEGFLEKHIEVPLYLGCGNLDELNIDVHTVKLYVLWRRHGWQAVYRMGFGRHDFSVWRAMMPAAMRYVFRAVQPPEPVAGPLGGLPETQAARGPAGPG